MSDIKGTNVAARLAPFHTKDDYATHDAIYGKGGYKSVATIADRDKIPKSRLDDGCMVFVRENNTKYIYDAATETFTKDSEVVVGGEIEVDNFLSEASQNPVQNAVITKELNKLAKKGGNVVMTQEEYDALSSYSTSITYVIVKDDEVKAIYIGKTLIATAGKTSNNFPYNLPINF
jgi:hypothetical protein